MRSTVFAQQVAEGQYCSSEQSEAQTWAQLNLLYWCAACASSPFLFTFEVHTAKFLMRVCLVKFTKHHGKKPNWINQFLQRMGRPCRLTNVQHEYACEKSYRSLSHSSHSVTNLVTFRDLSLGEARDRPFFATPSHDVDSSHSSMHARTQGVLPVTMTLFR